MGMTPEGKVKRKVSEVLKSTRDLFYDMPVPSGFGGSTLDYIGCHRGDFFAIETKAPGKKPTKRQHVIIRIMERAGGKVFVIDNTTEEALAPLKEWLNR